MELKDLMSGIGVAIDDAFGKDDDEAKGDRIFEIVQQIEKGWDLRFCKLPGIPSRETWPSLLDAASFILLDWRLWSHGSTQLEEQGVRRNIEFLEEIKDYFLPVFIFTNDNAEDVTSKLPSTVYRHDAPEESFVFVRHKADLFSEDALTFEDIENWIRANTSVYALKTWNRVLYAAKRELFSSMYARNSGWPRVFWKAYREDGVDPSSSLTHLINDNLRGRMRTDAFEPEVFEGRPVDVGSNDLRALIGESCFRPESALPNDEIRCGDMFRLSGKKCLLNIRPDCDCVPRNGGDVELYCIEGRRMRDADLRKQYREGHFAEKVWESVAFSVQEGCSVRFDFRKFRLEKFSALREQRVGRLLHPHLTRLQQRFGLYLQRQGLPRVPQEAIPLGRSGEGETES